MPIPVSSGSASTVPMASLARMDLGISMLVPLGWGIDGDESRIRLLGELENGRRPTFTLLQGEPEADGEEWFNAFREQAVARIAATAKGFVQLSVENFVLSSFVDVTSLHYRRDEPDPVSQLQAYLWATSNRMLVADAATARAHEDRDLPIFDAMLASIRLLPI